MKSKISLSLLTAIILSNNIYAKEIKKLDEITVTAQKTEENPQDVPISLTLFNEFDLEDKNIDSVSDLAKYTPGLEIIGYGTALKSAPSIRGMYSDYSARSSVAGLLVDGIPVTDGTGFDETLMDIERVEILKGPQGTLYGKNTEVGVINIITKKPNNETKGKIKLTFGSDNKKELAMTASGPIIEDILYIGLSGKHYEKNGFVKNYNTGRIEDNKKHDYGKIHLRYTPVDNLDISFLSSKIKYDDNANSSGSSKDKPREVGSDLSAFNKSEVLLNALNINYNINSNLSLSSTTSHRKYNEITANDFDYSDSLIKKFHMLNDSTYKTLSEELKINYQNANIKFVSGLFIEKEDTDYNKQTIMSMGSMDGGLTQVNKSLGLFSHLTYNINDKLSILGGLRYDKVKQEYKDSTQTINNNDSEISPKIGLTYDIKDNIMLYTTISKGYRVGGFNNYASSNYSKTYDKETLYSYEAGLKGSSINNRLTYSLAVYHMDISDMQVDVYANGQGSHVIKTNAAEATSQGIETSLNFQATDTIDFFAGFSYNNIEFDKYHDGILDYRGKTTMYSPKYNFNAGVLYRADNGYYASADINGYGDMYLDNTNKYKRGAYHIVNAKIGYEQENYDVFLYTKNLFDKNYDMNGVWGGGYNIYSQPREIGLQLTYRF